jgi:sugar lactone lactonase YvrE
MSITSALVVGLVAWITYPVFTSFPPPYGSFTATPGDAMVTSFQRFPAFPPDLSGVFAKNELLTQHATRLFEGQVVGTESVAVAPDGTLVMLDKFGYVHRAHRSSSASEYALFEDPVLYIGPGRPLGFHLVEDGAAIIVCDSLKGLLRVEFRTGAITVLANRVSGGSGPQPFGGDDSHVINYANDLDIASDGTIYFTSSTAGVVAQHPSGFYDTMRSFLLNMCSGDHTGRLLAHHPKSGATKEVLSGLWYANGVAMAHDEQSVLVVETMGFRVVRHWLAGPKQGQSETVISHLPGFPDGITRSSDGNYWLCLVAPISPLVKLLPSLGTTLRYALSHLVTSSLAKHIVKTWGCVIKLSPEGEVLGTLMDIQGARVSSVSAVTEFEGSLFLGNLKGDFVSVVSLRDAGLSGL